MLVFVYGTLTDPATAERVLDTFEYRGPATLDGLHRVDGRYPTLLPGGDVAGRLLETGAVDELDRYEGVDDGLYVRISIQRATQSDHPAARPAVQTYVGDPERLGVDERWPGGGPFDERVRQYLDEHEVVVRETDQGA